MATSPWSYWNSTTSGTTSCSDTWSTWTTNYDTATTAYTTSVWTGWCNSTTATASSSDTIVWVKWQDGTVAPASLEYDTEPVVPIERVRKVDRVRRLYQRNQQTIAAWYWDELQREQEEARRVAEETAQILLEELIGKEEMETYKETGHVLVKGKRNDYIIRKESTVIVLPKGKVENLKDVKKVRGRSNCVVLKERTPATDKVIGLKFALEHNEDEVLKIGNDQGERDFYPAELRAAQGSR